MIEINTFFFALMLLGFRKQMSWLKNQSKVRFMEAKALVVIQISKTLRKDNEDTDVKLNHSENERDEDSDEGYEDVGGTPRISRTL